MPRHAGEYRCRSSNFGFTSNVEEGRPPPLTRVWAGGGRSGRVRGFEAVMETVPRASCK
jgi:hypothetical protein